MNRKEKEDMEAQTPELSPDELNSEILRLQEQLSQSELRQAMEDVEKIELPLADGMIRTDSQSCIPITGLTPPEALVLAAMHGPKAGGKVFESLRVTSKFETNAVAEKLRLAAKYGMERIDKLFPGSEPKLPKNFVLAVRSGLGTVLPTQRLFDTKVTVGLPTS
jgi:hypothetical protein